MICDTCNRQATSWQGSTCKDCINMEKFKSNTPGFFLCSCGKADSRTNWGKGSLLPGLCFSCTFWTNIINKNSPTRRIINGKCYHIGESNNGPSRWNGFGGRGFKIRLFTGEVAETNNLWHQGTVPERFQEQLPNNAEFIND